MINPKKDRNMVGFSAVKRELFASLMEAEGIEVSPSISRRKTDEPPPLSYAQQRIWFLHELDPASPAYNLPRAVRLQGALNVSALEQSFNEIVRRHEVLRTTFVTIDESPVQMIAPPTPLRIRVLDLGELSSAEKEEKISELIAVEAHLPFDLSTGPLIRTGLVRLSKDEHVLLFTMHHIVSDALSTAVLVRELVEFYEAFTHGRVSPLEELPIQYADFAVWQREWLQGERSEKQLAYWEHQLRGAPTLVLPTDRPRPAVQSYKGTFHSFALSKELTEALNRLSQSEDATLFMTLLAAFKVLLYRYSGQTDISIGTPIAGRSEAATESLIGFFVNTLVLRTDLSSFPSFRLLIRLIRRNATSAFAHQDLPFESLVERLHPHRSLSHAPLFQVSFSFDPAPSSSAALKLSSLSLSAISSELHISKFDLTLSFSDSASTLVATFEYNTDLFDRSTIERMGAQLQTLLAAIVCDPDLSISRLPLLAATERELILQTWNRTERRYSEAQMRPVHELFEQAAQHRGEAVAVISAGAEISYRELNERANRVASWLRHRGVGQEVRVGVCMERSVEMVVAVLGVLKAGGCYVPLDPAYPQERLSFILQDAEVEIVIAQEHLREVLPPHLAEIVTLDMMWEASVENCGGNSGDRNLAYVIYTSGSTGQPKGVMISHASIRNRLLWTQHTFRIDETDRILQKTTYTFDASVWEIFVPLISGGCLVLARPGGQQDSSYLVEAIARERITVVQFVPSMLRVFLSEEGVEKCRSLKHVFCGGERLTAEDRQRFDERLPHATLHNLYGPTEASIDATHWPCVEDCRRAGIPIGRPLSNVQVYLLDRHLEPVPVGAPGELHIGGVGLARGYLNRPELTAEKFIPDPFGALAGARLYMTGDLARYLPDGSIEYLGRTDHQVKLRGFRIELGEIEAALAVHPSVQDGVVLLREREDGGQQLLAFVVAKPGAAPLTGGELREQLGRKLPEYMVPSLFIMLDELPLMPNGKLDRGALLALEATEARTDSEHVAGRTPVEELLADIWSGVLGGKRVGVHDNFFELGGHSLLATQVVSRVRRLFGVDVPLRRIFEAPTVAGLAYDIEEMLRDGQRLETMPIATVSREQDIPLSFAQQRLWFVDRLAPGSNVYNIPVSFRLEGDLEVEAVKQTLDEIVRRHEVLRTTFALKDGQPVQLIADAAAVALPLVDLADLPSEEREREVLRIALEESRAPFDLTRGPLLRAQLLRLGEREHVMLFTLHHIVSDGWSMGVLVREVVALYAAFVAGKPSVLPELPIQYADFAVWQRQQLEGATLEAHLDYWKRRLGGASPSIELPSNYVRSDGANSGGKEQSFLLPHSLSASLKALSQSEGTTLFMALLAAFTTVLYRYSGQDDIVLGTDVANRNRVETESLIGFFVNILVLRTDLSANPSFRELLKRVRESTLEAYAHQDLPFDKLVEALSPDRDASQTPLFQAKLVLQNAPVGELKLPGLVLRAVDTGDTTGAAKFDLLLTITDSVQGLAGLLSYRADLFDDETIAQLIESLQTLVEKVVANPDARLNELEIISETQRERLLFEFNDTHRDYESHACLHQLFEQQAERTPEHVAVAFDGRQLTYAELNRKANRLAHYLQSHGTGTETLVGICMERSLEMAVALLGIMKAGGAYVPLDPAYPKERLAFILDDACLSLLISQQHLSHLLPIHDARLILIDAEWHDIEGHSDSPVVNNATDEKLAYVIYTSGSTGNPKGAMLHHRGIVNCLLWMQETYRLDSSDKFLLKTSLNFDPSVWEFFWPLWVGASVEIAPAEPQDSTALVRLVAERSITTAYFVPSLLKMLLEEPGLTECVSLKRVICGGESLSKQTLRRFFEVLGVELHHSYGPTETSIASTEWTCQAQLQRARAPIGRPLANTQTYVLDEQMRPLPLGATGELYIGGEAVGRGYLHRAGLTAERYLPDEYGGRSGGRLYRTGDKVRYLSDGNLEYVGRTDEQVKVRGHRIELGEVQAALKAHEAVRETVVIVDAEMEETRLAVYVVMEKEAGVGMRQLREYLKGRLPAYMIPTMWMEMEEIPLTPSGKVNRRALPPPTHQTFEREMDYVGFQSPVEELLAGIWAEVLGVEHVGVHDNFFDLGGHSLLATQVISRTSEAFGVDVPLAYLFDQPTVATLSARVEEAISAGYKVQVSPIERIAREGQLPLSFGQQRLWFLHQLEPDNAAYNMLTVIQLSGQLSFEALERALSEVSRRHESLRTRFETVDGQPIVLIDEPAAMKVPVTDLSHLEADEREGEARRLAAAEQDYNFDLSRGPLMRVNLLSFAPDNQILLVTMHHIITDGWSTDVLSREMATLYHAYSEGQPSPLPELPIQYVDFAQWQREWLRHDALDTQLSYWRRQLGGNPPSLQLPYDYARSSTAISRGAHQDAIIPEALSEALKAFSRREGVTLFMTMLSAFKTLLYRHTGQEDILVGIPIAGRNRAETEGLIGLFLNTLVLRTDLSGSPSFRELLKREREVALGAYAHQDVPFEKLVAELQPDRELGRNPFFDVMVNFISAPTTVAGLEAPNLNYAELTEQQAQLPLMLIARDEGTQLALRLLYQDALFSSEKISCLLDQFQYLLAQVVQSPDASVDSYSLVTLDTAPLLPDAGVPLDEPAYVVTPDMCRVWARKMPFQIAVKQGDDVLTYGELVERAERLAQDLVAEGLSRGDVVAVTGERSIGLITSMLAVLMSRGVLLSIDRHLPAERQRLMLDQAKAKFMLYAGELSPDDAWLSEQQSLRIAYVDPNNGLENDATKLAVESAERVDAPLPALAPDDAAYIFFTSGTTGMPKGTLGNHKGLSHFLTWQRDTFGINAQDRAAQLTALSFDVVLRDIFTPLVSGATLCLPFEAEDFAPEQLIPWLAQEKITLLHAVPSLAQFWLAHAGAKRVVKDLKWTFFAGEPLPDVLVRRWREVFPEAGVINLYGPTETTLAKCYYEVPAEPSPGAQPVGRPLPQTQALIVNRQDRLCGIGEPGEILIRTPFRSLGYINAAEENQSRFVRNFFRSDDNDLLYRTGDSGRYRLDGSIEILGRIDNQVKIRGVRIEPEEIETVLVRHPALREAVVVAREDKPGDKQLVAYVVPEPRYAPTVAGRPRYRLPNNMAIVQLNKNESDYLYREVFELQAYIRHGITIDDGAFILDVGANIGLFSLYAQQMARATKIFAFEPTPVTFATLKTNISLYGSDVTLFNFGISSENKTATFTFFPRFSFLTGLYADPETEKEVVKAYVVSQQKTDEADLSQIEAEADEILEDRFAVETFNAQLRTLSSVIEENQIEQIDLLKINVEKSELDVLQGIKPEDWRKIKQIVMEVDVQDNLHGIETLLREHGFAYVVEQDIWLTETPLCYVYAVRTDLQEKLIVEQERGVHARPVPVLDAPFLTGMELKRYAAERLPLYMIPSAFVMMDELPLTPNGKVDRRALPAPDRNAAEQRDAYAPPRNHIEEVLAEIWTEVLGVERVGIYDNFFDLGGHSLVVTRMISRVRKAFQIELPVRKVFEEPTVAALARSVEALQSSEHLPAPAPPIERVSREGKLPISFAQEASLLIARREGRPAFYSRVLHLKGALDITAAERALGEIIRRHESLRTTFVTVGDETVQVVSPQQQFKLPLVDLSTLPASAREERAMQLSIEEMHKPFDLAEGPLLRTVLFKLDEEEYFLSYTILHIICDLWSLGIFNRELAVLYEAFFYGRPSPLPQLPIQYADFAHWERAWLKGDILEDQLGYWQRQLKGCPATLQIPTDRVRTPAQTFRGADKVLQIPDALYKSLGSLCQREAVTLYMASLAAFNILLERYTGQRDIVVGTAIAGRSRGDVEGLMGHFNNFLAIRTDLSGNPTFKELLARVRETVAGAYAHQDINFWKMIEELHIPREPNRSPLVQVGFVLHHQEDETFNLPGLEARLYPLDIGTVPLELIVSIIVSAQGLNVNIEYNVDLFEEATIARMLRNYQTLLEAIVDDIERPLAELPI